MYALQIRKPPARLVWLRKEGVKYAIVYYAGRLLRVVYDSVRKVMECSPQTGKYTSVWRTVRYLRTP
jgi:hypothetical protein